MQKCYFMLLFYAQEFYLKNSFVKNEVYFDLFKNFIKCKSNFALLLSKRSLLLF